MAFITPTKLRLTSGGVVNLDSMIGSARLTSSGVILDSGLVGLQITLTGIADGVHTVSFVKVTDPLVPVLLSNQDITFTGGVGSIDNATLGVTAGDAVMAVQLGSNPKTTGGVGWSVAT